MEERRGRRIVERCLEQGDNKGLCSFSFELRVNKCLDFVKGSLKLFIYGRN
jgi:hypothetical protein